MSASQEWSPSQKLALLASWSWPGRALNVCALWSNQTPEDDEATWGFTWQCSGNEQKGTEGLLSSQGEQRDRTKTGEWENRS